MKRGESKEVKGGDGQMEEFLTTPDSVFVFRLSLTFGKSIQENKTVTDGWSQCKTKARDNTGTCFDHHPHNTSSRMP